jgi:uncharacterized protein
MVKELQKTARRAPTKARIREVCNRLIRLLFAYRVPVNVWFWWPALLFLNYVQYLFLGQIEGIAVEYRAWIWLAGGINSLVLISGLALLDGLIERLCHGSARWIWGGIAGSLVASFFADFLLFKMMAIHLPTGLRLLLENGLGQFFLTVEASGVRSEHLREFGIAMVVAFLVGVLLTRTTWKLSKQRVLCISVGAFSVNLALLILGLTVWELTWRGKNASLKAWGEVHRLMPFSVDLVHRAPGESLRVGPLRELREPEGISKALDRIQYSGGKQPDIFVFVIESARGDYVDPRVTPNLVKLSQECPMFNDSVANANASHVSWFSLFTANQPLYFAMVAKRQEHWGSVPLRALKRIGYEIQVLAATYLNYHNLDQIIFGPNLHLADSFTDARELDRDDRPDRDREITQRLFQRIEGKVGGRIFFVFYESTHHDYYWPSDGSPPFQPFAENWDYFDFDISREELARIQNRYRNAFHFIDRLIGEALQRLKAEGRYDDSLILVTGDHGEEFLEHGKLVHASELWREQTHVPFLLKLPKSLEIQTKDFDALTASHLDFLPTILDYLGVHASGLWDGESLLRKKRDFVITADDNGARDPYRFCLHSEAVKAWFEYRSDSTMIALEPEIYLTRLTDSRDRALSTGVDSKQSKQLVEKIFGEDLKLLYPQFEK